MTAPMQPRRLEDERPGGPGPTPRDPAGWRNGLGVVALGLGALALLTPLSRIEVQGRVGLLLVLAAVLELAHGFRRSTEAGRRAAWLGGAITLAMGVLLINAPYFASTAIVLFLAGWFGLDGVRQLAGAFLRRDTRRSALAWISAGLGNLLVCGALLVLRGRAMGAWTVAAAGAARIFGTAVNIFLSPVFTAGDSGDTAVADLLLPEDPEVRALARRLAEEESARASIDRGWVLGFIATLFAIHVGRMGFDRTFLGVVSPGFATLGDLAIALLLAFVVVIPCSVLWRRLTRGPERRLWGWCLKVPEAERGWGRKAVGALVALPAPPLDPPGPGALLRPHGPEPGPPDRPASRGRRRGDRPGLGHQLVLRHRELGGRAMELLGGGAHRHLARGDGPAPCRRRSSRRGRRGRSPSPRRAPTATSRSSSSATPARATPRSTACGLPSSRWSGAPRSSSSSSRRTSCTRPAR